MKVPQWPDVACSFRSQMVKFQPIADPRDDHISARLELRSGIGQLRFAPRGLLTAPSIHQ